jgi:hypothetical protein
MEEKSLRETLADINKNLEDLSKEKKVKSWNLPFTARVGMGKKKKREGYVVFMNIAENKAVTFIKAPVVEKVAMVNGVPHVVNPEDILIWKNKIPLVVQPQWSEFVEGSSAYNIALAACVIQDKALKEYKGI